MTGPRILAIIVALTVLCCSAKFDFAGSFPQDSPSANDPRSDVEKIDNVISQISAAEWLGPMAPIALSPFFGITCLSAMSVFGQDTIVANNQFISTNPVLNNQAVFWTFLVLTLLTSLPRLTKVSKPIAQVLDQIETYSGIITLIVIRMLAEPAVDSAGLNESQVVEMGFLSFTGDMLLIVAAAINIFVINMVKFFFEALVWITPFPAIDAIFEVCNKIVCLALMAIYAWSPMVAMVLNLVLFSICVMVFRRIHRRVVYMRTMLTDPVWSMLSKQYGSFEKRNALVVFPQSDFGDFPAKTRLLIRRAERGWVLECPRFPLFPSKLVVLDQSSTNIEIDSGFLLNKLVVHGDHEGKLIFSRRYSDQLPLVADRMGFVLSADAADPSPAIA